MILKEDLGGGEDLGGFGKIFNDFEDLEGFMKILNDFGRILEDFKDL